MEVSNDVLAVLVIIAMAVSITGTMSLLSVLPERPAVITGMAQDTAAGTANVTLSSEASIILLVSTVDFGTIAAGGVNDTADFNPHPFVLNNNGSARINVSIAESTGDPLWTLDDTCENCFQFNSTNNQSGTDFTSCYDWTDFSPSNQAENASASQIVVNPANLVYNLSQATNEDSITVHLNISVPGGESGGDKGATIYFLATET